MYGSMRNALDNSLMIHDLEFRVVGVFQESVDTFGQSELSSYSVLVPITAMGYFQSFERIDPLYVSVRSQQQVEKAAALVRNTLELRNCPGSATVWKRWSTCSVQQEKYCLPWVWS